MTSAPSSEATPRPWYFSPWHIEEGPPAVRAGSSPAANYICTTASDADAQLIVAAVNSYDESRKLLREAAELIAEHEGIFGDITSDNLVARITAHLEGKNV